MDVQRRRILQKLDNLGFKSEFEESQNCIVTLWRHKFAAQALFYDVLIFPPKICVPDWVSHYI